MTDIKDDEYVESEDLLYSYTYGVRLLHTGGKKDEIIIGIMLEETDDSFLIGMAASISRSEKDRDLIILEQVANGIAYLRFMKTSFRAVSFPSPDYEEAYLHFLKSESPKIFPELLNLIGEDTHSESWEEPQGLQEQEKPKTEYSEERIEPQITKPIEQQTEKGILIDGPFTKEELKKKIEDAIKEGSLLTTHSALPN
jgi:hypothetical protein